ncbi:uncharacterized protein L969DRAFT_84997 [Mixia osmundae IAM 14324]|uniref:Uncharacterized protein n=1 Tax=Mixia osmundae (strain CBS 9802 / IAM 14324 / JCM 22182 / KY 12970) TaxID=764103 RepID=G7DXG1_MIXOS|nr:uncharacterized protein L969DRAFT_84997 [Mixia osmundae IAM 14324]KEI41235.1 hypothetical protein L969DRAFT_84997 [Mixia osmundae IAM 14324]GAA95271.1 hypothetical protein E5Q_01927 [Mixia osmundae IAM 14324]
MPLFEYGEFGYACRHVPSLPVCNLFLSSLLRTQPSSSYPYLLNLPDPASNGTFGEILAHQGVGVRSRCAIARASTFGGSQDDLGNLANIIFAALSILLALVLIHKAKRRQAAVGRIEITVFFALYGLQCLLQIVTLGSIVGQGTAAVVVLTALHLATVVAMFFVLTWTGLLGLQLVDDGTAASLIPMSLGSLIAFVGTLYISLDKGLRITAFFEDRSIHPGRLKELFLFTLTIVWPLIATVVYFATSLGVTILVLREGRPALIFLAALLTFVLSQGIYYGLSEMICLRSGAKVDGSFLATFLESVTIVLIYLGWSGITEDEWDEYALSPAT